MIRSCFLGDLEMRDAQGRRITALLPEVSETTARLIDLLVARDQAGRAKYGTTLDRTDLSLDDWLQHMTEELLDAAGYAQAALRTHEEPTK